jgi:murein DD-endopeptidase MepM/ murein hydrolase activator NlpD
MAVNVAKTISGSTAPSMGAQTEENCEQYLHWDLGLVNLETFMIRPNDVFSQILSSKGVEYFKIDQLINAAGNIFPLRSIRAGKELTFIKDSQDSSIQCVIYEPDAYRQILYHIDDSIHVEVIERQKETRLEVANGRIDNSLWASMEEQNIPTDLILAMEDALGYSVDFYHIQKGDEFRLVYERVYVEGQPVGVGKLIGANYTSNGNTFYSIRYNSGKYDGYYDLEGRPMKKAFLKSPVQYSRISSRFSNNRFHPVLKRNKGHFGTDYAANCGTPIRAVADGTIVKRDYTSGNGNYIKIRHDKTYETQYLHMSKFGPGIRPGVRVSQGQTIGYVGRTGLATGCHVCFRFWKNGRQVDHLREKMPPPQAMDPSQLPEYFKTRDQIKALLLGEQAVQPQPVATSTLFDLQQS